MDISNQNLDTTEITIRNNSKINAKNLWKYDDNCEYQIHATIFSTDSTTESDETISSFKKIKYYISGHFHATNTVMCFGITQDPDTKDYMMVLDYYEGGNLRNTLVKEPVNSTDYLSSFQETISSSSANPISECLDCELNELDLNQDDDE
ncbi:unnamed protein product [Rhizophagus irregularis]|uniref:Protein kinase domain-containing protein n=1 Tax=Rhizophagus irregularis TaxID=588596 RepID=A0A915YZ92_9GLOM|nr:unnamed protein product [Rhizophagus irregularis]